MQIAALFVPGSAGRWPATTHTLPKATYCRPLAGSPCAFGHTCEVAGQRPALPVTRAHAACRYSRPMSDAHTDPAALPAILHTLRTAWQANRPSLDQRRDD